MPPLRPLFTHQPKFGSSDAALLLRLACLVYVCVGTRGLGEAVVGFGVHVARRESVQLLLGHAALLVIADDRQLVHVVGVLGEEGLGLVLDHPARRLPDVLVHRRGHAADHPAVAVAVPDLRAHGLGLRRVPQLVPGLAVEVAHDLLVPGAVAGHDVAVGVDEERVEGHVAGKEPRLSVDVVDEAVVEVGAEPFLWFVALQELVHQRLEVLGDHGPVVDDVLGLHEVEAVVQARRGELHAELIGEFI